MCLPIWFLEHWTFGRLHTHTQNFFRCKRIANETKMIKMWSEKKGEEEKWTETYGCCFSSAHFIVIIITKSVSTYPRTINDHTSRCSEPRKKKIWSIPVKNDTENESVSESKRERGKQLARKKNHASNERGGERASDRASEKTKQISDWRWI